MSIDVLKIFYVFIPGTFFYWFWLYILCGRIPSSEPTIFLAYTIIFGLIIGFLNQGLMAWVKKRNELEDIFTKDIITDVKEAEKRPKEICKEVRDKLKTFHSMNREVQKEDYLVRYFADRYSFWGNFYMGFIVSLLIIIPLAACFRYNSNNLAALWLISFLGSLLSANLYTFYYKKHIGMLS